MAQASLGLQRRRACDRRPKGETADRLSSSRVLDMQLISLTVKGAACAHRIPTVGRTFNSCASCMENKERSLRPTTAEQHEYSD